MFQSNIKREINHGISSYLVEKGLRLGDEFVLSPLYGHKKTMKLHRTSIHFSSKNEPSEFGHNYQVPTLSDENLSFSLTLCPNGAQPDAEAESRYLFKSNNDQPFKINGCYSFESFIERGDRVQIGHNFLNFRNSFPLFQTEDHHEILLQEGLMKSMITVLIEGQSGTGKTHLARLIHKKSERKGPFLHINLSSLSTDLVESELFGHTLGAFSGAVKEKVGALLEAEDGTLFLDEIDALSIEIQSKLLLFLDNRKIRPVGSNKMYTSNSRILFASSKTLEHLVQSGGMREDFYFRISSGKKIELSPLRDDQEKIKRLCFQFALKNDVCFSSRLIEFYQTLPWPGNIRQLQGHLDKKKILTKSRKIDFDELDEDLIMRSSSLSTLILDDKFETLETIKLGYVLKVYSRYAHDKDKTCKVLSISRKTLNRMLSESKSVPKLQEDR